ncbi:TPA: amino acid ABC transporter substrate-binding protein [Streptococcus agalactiae]
MLTHKNILLTIIFGLFMIILSACGMSNKEMAGIDNWEHYQKEKKITIGFDNTFVPMGFESRSGDYIGFDIDLANAVFKEYGISVKWQPINWDMKETELNNGNIDLIWNGYSKTAERAKKVAFTNPYMNNHQVIVTKTSSHINSIKDMKGKKLGAQSGSSGFDAFNAKPDILKKFVKGKEAVQYDTFTQALIDLKNNRIDGLLIDEVYANYYLKQEGNIKAYYFVKTAYQEENFVVGARKVDRRLIEKINKAFKQLHNKGRFQKISYKWFGEDVYSKE